MRNLIHQYKIRLTNLSQSNRSLRLSKLSPRRDLDLMQVSYSDGIPAAKMLERVISGKEIILLNGLSSRDESTNILDRRLNQIFREVQTIQEESGGYELFLGYPFVEGKFLDGTIARAPVILFPVKLIRNFTGKPRWTLEIPEDAVPIPNKTFFLAYEKFHQQRLTKEFWETNFPDFEDLQAFLNYLYKFIQSFDLELNVNQDLFHFGLEPTQDFSAALMENWELGKLRFKPNAVLGIFPQADSALLQDYEILEKEPALFPIEKMLKHSPDSSPERRVPEGERYFITPVDQSQEEALLKVKNGKSLVIHGPPGTGKSQVILNLVSDALANGKTVLVCSQKRAALDVVATRLTEKGLGSYFAQVHDFRIDKAEIFQKIRTQIQAIEDFRLNKRDLTSTLEEHSLSGENQDLEASVAWFDALYAGLISTNPFGISAHELYLALVEMPEKKFLVEPESLAFQYGTFTRAIDLFETLLDYQEYFSESHPWMDRKSMEHLGTEDREQMLALLENMPTTLSTLSQMCSDLKPLGELIPDPEKILPRLNSFRELETQLEEEGAQDEFTELSNLNESVDAIQKELEKVGKWIPLRQNQRILKDYPWNLLADLKKHFSQYQSKPKGLGRWFSLDWLKARWYVDRVLKKGNGERSQPWLDVLSSELTLCEEIFSWVKRNQTRPFWRDFPLLDSPESWSGWLQKKSKALDVFRKHASMAYFGEMRPRILQNKWDSHHWDQVKSWANALEQFAQILVGTRQEWAIYLSDSQIEKALRQLNQMESSGQFADQLFSTFRTGNRDLQAIDQVWSKLSSEEKALWKKLRIHWTQYGPKEFIQILKQSVFSSWLRAIEKQHPQLEEIGLRGFHRKLDSFRNSVLNRPDRVRKQLLRRLQASILENIEVNRLKNPVTYRELLHQVSKKRQLWPIRRLIKEFWAEEIRVLVPCWLASPEAVAAIFPMEPNLFDLVIFDEASQCYVERSLPISLRGKVVVVAGDEKQLPPSDLYKVRVEEEEEGKGELAVAFEADSILALGKTVFDESWLQWHYRSQDPALIRFSNLQFYDGRLKMTPPRQPNPQFLPPIQWVFVPNGNWMHLRNVPEIEALLEKLKEILSEDAPPSVGIVTFNFAQQEAILDYLDQIINGTWGGWPEKATRTLGLRMNHPGEQSLFVKNIENVQGDERDIILFSIGYAKNEKGKVAAQFGLLNLEGGENRLNVAVSRAKKQVILFCSFFPHELNVEDVQNKGPQLLKKYLEYGLDISKSESLPMAKFQSQTEKEEPLGLGSISLAERLFQQLSQRGERVIRGVGESGNQLDLAVLDKRGTPIVGIECEGYLYFSGKSAKEREVYRPHSWAQKGWPVYRVWARNYQTDPEKELTQILQFIEEHKKDGTN